MSTMNDMPIFLYTEQTLLLPQGLDDMASQAEYISEGLRQLNTTNYEAADAHTLSSLNERLSNLISRHTSTGFLQVTDRDKLVPTSWNIVSHDKVNTYNTQCWIKMRRKPSFNGHNLNVRFHDIFDALCEKDRVLFSIRSYCTSNAKQPSENQMTVVSRYHDDFVWLHDAFVENDDYAGMIIPPVPCKPDFNDIKAKLNKLTELEGSLDSARISNMKKELDGEYRAKFKKAITNHEYFLKRLVENPKFGKDDNLSIFLSFEGSLDVRGKNKKEVFSDFLKTLAIGADKLLRPHHKDSDEYFSLEKTFLDEYVSKVNDAKRFALELKKNTEEISSAMMQSHAALDGLRSSENPDFAKFLQISSEVYEQIRKVSNKSVDNIDLKLQDTFKYLHQESTEALNLLHRRYKSLGEFENANQAVDKARLKRRDISTSEKNREFARLKFEKISQDAKEDLKEFANRRAALTSTHLKQFVTGQADIAAEQVALLDSFIDKIESVKRSVQLFLATNQQTHSALIANGCVAFRGKRSSASGQCEPFSKQSTAASILSDSHISTPDPEANESGKELQGLLSDHKDSDLHKRVESLPSQIFLPGPEEHRTIPLIRGIITNRFNMDLMVFGELETKSLTDELIEFTKEIELSNYTSWSRRSEESIKLALFGKNYLSTPASTSQFIANAKKLSMFGLAIPKEYGGLELGPIAIASCFEAAGIENISSALYLAIHNVFVCRGKK
ncbi:hypothetical protein GJ496_010205 [Pomphorhynchus laevis]|nr:hypothetical protein GJ496_010205 [Pomphorhynchus laevis]